MQSLQAVLASGSFKAGSPPAHFFSTWVRLNIRLLFMLTEGGPPRTAYSDQSLPALAFFQLNVPYFHSK